MLGSMFDNITFWHEHRPFLFALHRRKFDSIRMLLIGSRPSSWELLRPLPLGCQLTRLSLERSLSDLEVAATSMSISDAFQRQNYRNVFAQVSESGLSLYLRMIS